MASLPGAVMKKSSGYGSALNLARAISVSVRAGASGSLGCGSGQPYNQRALAAMVELLAGPLIGDMTSAESLAWDNGAGGLPYGGELILALDPQRFLGAQAQEQLARAETLFNAMQDQGARLPGERRFACRQQSERQGVAISRSLHDEICALRQGG